jgi:hypothetical protein
MFGRTQLGSHPGLVFFFDRRLFITDSISLFLISPISLWYDSWIIEWFLKSQMPRYTKELMAIHTFNIKFSNIWKMTNKHKHTFLYNSTQNINVFSTVTNFKSYWKVVMCTEKLLSIYLIQGLIICSTDSLKMIVHIRMWLTVFVSSGLKFLGLYVRYHSTNWGQWSITKLQYIWNN